MFFFVFTCFFGRESGVLSFLLFSHVFRVLFSVCTRFCFQLLFLFRSHFMYFSFLFCLLLFIFSIVFVFSCFAFSLFFALFFVVLVFLMILFDCVLSRWFYFVLCYPCFIFFLF